MMAAAPCSMALEVSVARLPVGERGAGPAGGDPMIARSRQSAVVLGSAFLALLFAVQPAAAATVISTTGTVGNYAIHDNHDTTRGADCDYETTRETHHGAKAYWLDAIKVRGPQIYAYNDHSGTKQWVGWQFRVQDEPASATDAWQTFYTSSVVKQRVNVSTGVQFDHRVWKAPESLPADTNWRVVVTLKWFTRPSSTTVQGTVRASIDYYHVKGGGATNPPTIRQTDCYVSN